MQSLLPALGVPESLLTQDGGLDPQTLFSTPKKALCLEIGFGSGEHLAALLRAAPDTGFLGAEPFINGMAAFLKDITPDRPDNIRVLMDDALLLVRSLKDRCLDKIYILNPDPWPKKRHHKRRIINPDNLDQFARVLKPATTIVMATDVDNLADWMQDQCEAHHRFELESKEPPPEWRETRYAFKGKQAGRRQSFLTYRVIS